MESTWTRTTHRQRTDNVRELNECRLQQFQSQHLQSLLRAGAGPRTAGPPATPTRLRSSACAYPFRNQSLLCRKRGGMRGRRGESFKIYYLTRTHYLLRSPLRQRMRKQQKQASPRGGVKIYDAAIRVSCKGRYLVRNVARDGWRVGVGIEMKYNSFTYCTIKPAGLEANGSNNVAACSLFRHAHSRCCALERS